MAHDSAEETARARVLGAWLRHKLGLVGRSPDYRRLWLGESVSLFGDQIAIFALPTLAILTLDASSFEVGALNVICCLSAGWPAGRRVH